MKSHQPHSTDCVLQTMGARPCALRWPRSRFGLAEFWQLAAALCLLAAPSAKALSSTNTWVGAGADSQWSTTANWNAGVAPGVNNGAMLTNAAAIGLPGTNGIGAVGTPNITVTADTTVGQLWFDNTNTPAQGTNFHTIGISPGATLTVSNSAVNLMGSSNILQVMSAGGGATLFGGIDNNQQTIYATIQGGAGSTLNVNATNGVTQWFHGNLTVQNGVNGGGAFTEPLNATLDLSGLDNFNAAVNHLCVGGDGAPGAYFLNRARGTLWLAKTNNIILLATGTFPNEGATYGIWAGLNAQNNGAGTNHQGSIFLGLTNSIFCNTGIGLGLRGNSGYLGFNTNYPPGAATAFFRDRTTGIGRQTLWSLGDRIGTASEGQDVRGVMDFSLGSVDALVGTLRIGVAAVNANRAIGSLGFGAGVIDVNTLILGCQVTSGMGPAQGLMIVSNTAVLKINTSAQISTNAGTLVAGSNFGQIIVTNGGTVLFGNTATITCGTAISSEIDVVNGSSLAVGTVGKPSAPLTTLTVVSNNTLTVDLGSLPNPSAAPVQVTTLNTAGTNTLNILGTGLIKGTITLIKYGSWINDGGPLPCINFKMGTNSIGVVGYITNNLANSSIDFVVTTGTATSLVWNGITNGVPIGSWDIAVTTNWQGLQKYTQVSIPGSLVQFDDTAAGTTTVSINTNVAPVLMIVTNNSTTYSFTGSGSLFGPGKLIKDGLGLMTLSNSGTNSSTGEIDINNGTLQIAGSSDRLPVSGSVVLANLATAALDLNSFNQTLGSISGGGTSGGNITEGSGTLSITGSGSYDGVISGSGGLIKKTGGSLKLTAANLYSGGTIVSNGVIVVANGTGSGLGSGSVLIASGNVQLGDGLTANGNVTAPTITNNSALNLLPVSDYTLTNLIVGTGSLNKLIGAGSATIYITNANYFTGGSSIGQGRVQISSPQALGTGTIACGNQTGDDTWLALSGGITVTNTISLPAKTGGIIPPVDHIKNVDSTNTLTGNLVIAGSTVFAIGSDNGTLIIAGNLVNSQVANPGRFFLRGGGNGIFQGTFSQGAGNPLELNKWDSGTWILAATNSYTGATVINGGKLVVNGAIQGSSRLAIGFGASLAGSGTITAVVTNEGTIFPGDDTMIGTLTISNSLFCDSGTEVAMDVSTNGNDQIRGLTQVIYGGTLQINLAGTLTGNCVFKLFDAAAYVGTFDAINLPDITPLAWDTSYLTVDGTLHATNGPVVTPAITTSGYSGGVFLLSGTGTLVAPYSILATTNLTTPFANWSNIGGGTFSNGTFNFADPAASNFPARFYRLSTPTP